MSYQVRLFRMSVWTYVPIFVIPGRSRVISGVIIDPTGVKVLVKLVILDQTVLKINDWLTLLRTTTPIITYK